MEFLRIICEEDREELEGEEHAIDFVMRMGVVETLGGTDIPGGEVVFR